VDIVRVRGVLTVNGVRKNLGRCVVIIWRIQLEVVALMRASDRNCRLMTEMRSIGGECDNLVRPTLCTL
jgi:hypothetical protein